MGALKGPLLSLRFINKVAAGLPSAYFNLNSNNGAHMLQIRPLKQSLYFNGIIPYPFRPKSTLKRPHVSKNAIEKSQNLDLVTFTLIIDDLVFWDGSTKMAQLGGGGSQSAWGYQTVSSPNFDGGDFQIERAAGIAAGVGPDVPSSCLEWLENIGIDIRGIQQHPNAKTPRAWQILEQDGRRHEVFYCLRNILSICSESFVSVK